MGRAPTYTLLLLPQITLSDVYAFVADLGLDVDEFIAEVLDEPSGERDADFIDAVTWSELDTAEVSDTWKKLGAELRNGKGGFLAHSGNPNWSALAKTVRSNSIGLLLQPAGVRTLGTSLQKTGWDYRRMPNDTLGADGTLAELVEKLRDRVLQTIGGAEYLVSDDQTPARALTLLATTLAAVLRDGAATITDNRLRARVLRPDIYEGAVEGAGLGKYFQAIRHLVEIDHPEHVRVPVNGPGSPEQDFGLIEYRGRGDQYLLLNVPAAKKWLDPRLLQP